MKVFTVLVAFGVCLPTLPAEVQPRWWTTSATTILASGTPLASNRGPANLGQLKNVARKAKHYLDRSLVAQGGAGREITAMILAFEPRTGQSYSSAQIAQYKAGNLSPINLGQLKNVGKLFYDRLLAVGFNTNQSLSDNGLISWSYNYPWNPDPNSPKQPNYSWASLGQLKLVFSFEFDSDDDGLDDNWETHFFGNLQQGPASNPDGDGLSNLQESDLWTDPLVWDDSQNLDSNNDGIFDDLSVGFGIDPFNLDVDDDGLINSTEYALGTNAFWRDSDGDNVVDGLDQFPLDPNQSQFPNPSGDTTAPLITLLTPGNAVLLP